MPKQLPNQENPETSSEAAEKFASDEELMGVRTEIIQEYAKDARKSAHDLARWTIASLLVANGGALIGLLRPEGTRSALFEGAGWAFVGGFLAALLAGFFNSLHAATFATAMEHELWTGEAVKEASYQTVIDKAAKKAAGSGLLSFFLLIAAFAAFGIGCWMVSNPSGELIGGSNSMGAEEQSSKAHGGASEENSSN